jgi:hypothetical protein
MHILLWLLLSDMCESSPLTSLLGPDDNNDPIAIDDRDRGEHSAESLRDDSDGEGGSSCE